MLFRKRKNKEQIRETQWKILQMLTEGLGCRQMKDRLHISEASIRYYLRKVYKELNASSIIHAVLLFERKKYANLLSALKELSEKDQPLANLLKQFNLL